MSIFTLQCECPGKSIFSGFIPTMQFVLLPFADQHVLLYYSK